MPRKNHPHRKEQRRKDASERQAAYDESTTQTKLENIETRRGNSRREKDFLHHGRRKAREEYRHV